MVGVAQSQKVLRACVGTGWRGCPERGPWKVEDLSTCEILPIISEAPGGRNPPGWHGGGCARLSRVRVVVPMVLTSSPGSFGICLVPQASEDKFDCYKCHWWEGSMCGYGICE